MDLELAIAADPLFELAYVFGDNRPFIIVVLNRAQWERLAASLQLDASAPASLQESTARTAALERIRSLTRGVPHYAQPRAAWLTLDARTPENALMTPMLKIKRNNLATRFGWPVLHYRLSDRVRPKGERWVPWKRTFDALDALTALNLAKACSP